MSGDRFVGHDPARGHDTAGVPWAGRTLTGSGFDDDTGTADAALTDALAALRAAGRSQGEGPSPEDERDLVQAVAAARLLVPVVAVPGETAQSATTGLAADASSDMAAVTLTAPDGTRALPAFTDLAALARWDPQARPVPVEASRAAQAAVQEGCQVIVLDPPPPGTPVGEAAPAYVLRGSMVWALAMGRRWCPPHQDPAVAAAVAAAVRDVDAVTGHALAAGPGGALRIELGLVDGLGPAVVQELVTGIGQRIAADGEVRARIDALAFGLRAGG